MNDQVTDHLPHEIKAAREELNALYGDKDWTGEEVACHARYCKEGRSPGFMPWDTDETGTSTTVIKLRG